MTDEERRKRERERSRRRRMRQPQDVEYIRRWQAKNPEKVLEYQRRYRTRHREALNAKRRVQRATAKQQQSSPPEGTLARIR